MGGHLATHQALGPLEDVLCGDVEGVRMLQDLPDIGVQVATALFGRCQEVVDAPRDLARSVRGISSVECLPPEVKQ